MSPPLHTALLLLPLTGILACVSGPKKETGVPPVDTDGTGPGDSSDTAPSDSGPVEPDPCAEVDAFWPNYADTIATWTAQDDLAPWPADPVVFVGSSTLRRWEGLARAYTDHTPLQRGFGGAQLAEVARSCQDLVVRHDPRAVVVFAGTNDVDAGVDAQVVVERFRCLRQRLAAALGADRPLVFVGITPTPARWSQWEQASAVNQAVAALAEEDDGVWYADTPTAFLATGSPPDASLFVEDGLHLSDAGYALWDSVLRPVVEAVTDPTPPASAAPLAPGTRLLLDLGPSNAEDGEPTPSPDYLGQRWNNWYPIEGDQEVLPGEHLDNLVTSAGAPTDVDLVVTGGFLCNGRANGGLLWPDGTLLGDLAVGSATGDFFYVLADDKTGGFFLRGLDPAARYTLRLFASRDDSERRVTRYTASGATSASGTLQTSGPGAGHEGGTGNDDDVVELTNLEPDPWGHLFVDVAIEEGSYAYLSLLELSVEGATGLRRPGPGRLPRRP